MDETLPGDLNEMLQGAKPLLPAHENGFDEDELDEDELDEDELDEDASDRGDPLRWDRGEPPKPFRYMGGYSNSSKFSDLTLVDDSGNQHLVHRHVLCAASPFFEKTIQSLLQDSGDPARQTIKIHDTHPAIVYCGLDFIYNMTYDEPYKRSPIPSRKEYEQRILFNTNVYAFARKHEIGALEKFAVNKIEMDLRHEVETNPCGMPRLVLEILETVPDEEEPQAGYKGDFPLHKLLVKACVPKYDRFYWNFPEAYEVRTRYPRLIEDILNY
ncbi:hypothetical protein HDK64DRAFT_310926 [Phyllosticta capitalensis]